MPPPLDVLLQIERHGGALRELARVLLRDDADAEDAVQETWRRVLCLPPRHHERLGGWLAAILRNVAFRLRRSESRRVRHEGRAAARAPVVAEDHAQRIARAELAHRLITAVDALDAPYRDAIWQRFFEGRAPRDIAAASGVPLATVKSRLQRGLATLRDRLGEREGSDWRAGFASAFGFGKEGTTAAAAIAGGVLMATWTKVSVAAVAAAVIAAMVWWPDTNAAAPVAAVVSSPPPVASAADFRAKQPDASVENERTAAAGATNGPKLDIVRGRCVDEAGRPFAGGRVRVSGSVWHPEKLARWVLDHGELQPVEAVSEPSRDDGVFSLAFSPPPPGQFPSIRVECAGRATIIGQESAIAPSATIDLGDVVVPRGVLVRGRVVDGSGAPVAGVQIDVQATLETSRRARISARFEAGTYRADRTDDSGSFDLEVPLLPGSYMPRVMDGCVVQSPATLELAADRPVEDVVIVVARSDVPRIRGTVVDELDRPLSGVRVGTEHDSMWSTSDGTFELRCVAGDATKPARLTIGDDDSMRSVVHGDVAWGTRDLVVRVACGVLTVRVVDREGQPVPKGLVHVAAAVPAGPIERADGRQPFALGSRVHAMLERGAARFDRIERGSYRAIVEFGSNSPLLPLVVPFEFTGGAQQIVLRAGTEATRKLKVQAATGAPVAGTRVQLCEMLGNGFDGEAIVREPDAWFWRGGRGNVLVLEEGTTDANGVLPVRGPADRAMGLRVLGPGHVPVERSDVWFTTDADLVVTVQVGARLRGRVGPAGVMDELRRLARGGDAGASSGEGRPIVQLYRGENARRYVPDPSGPGTESDRFRIGGDGTFDVGGLPSDRWHVQVRYWQSAGGISSTKDVDVGEVTLRDGETVVLDPDLSRLLPGTLEAQVLRNGVPWAGAQLQLDCERGVRADGRPEVDGVAIKTDADGRFTHTGGAGKYSLQHVGMAGSPRANGTVAVERGRVARGTFTFAIGTLALRVLDPAGQPARGVCVFVRPGDGRGVTQDDGSVSFELSAGAVTLHTLPRRFETPEGRSEVAVRVAANGSSDSLTAYLVQIGSATVVAGRTTTLELRLPLEWDK